jgi:UDP-glucose:(heptosyl)LPS alpha-1,3-glucosyltransferase
LRFAFLIFKYFPFGGVQRDMLRIASDCAAKGHEVTIYTGQWRGEQPVGNIKVVCLTLAGLFNHQRHQSLINAMAQQLEQHPPDLAVGFNRMPGLDVYYAADPCFMERVHATRGCWYRLTGRYRFFAATEQAVMREDGKCKILLLSPREKMLFQHWYHTPESRFYLLPPSIPLSRFSRIGSLVARRQLRQEFNLPSEAQVLLLVGSAFLRKGLDRAIRGLAALPELVRANTWLLAVGEDRAEPMMVLADRLDVSEHVIITSGRADVPQLMAGADLLVHPARSELAGIVLIEALTVGLPVLVTELCGYAQHIAAAGAGLLLPSPFEQQDFDHALLTMLTSPERSRWSDAGRRYSANIAANTSPTIEADLLETFASERRG